MTIAPSAIKQQIVDILKADHAFDGVNLFIQGVPYRVPTQYYPFCMVIVTTEISESHMTGLHRRAYSGVIQFVNLVQDIWTVTDREAIVPSAVVIDTLVRGCVALFHQTVHQNLDTLTFEGGAVTNFVIDERRIEYGIVTLERQDSLHNFGAIPWQCKTLERFA